MCSKEEINYPLEEKAKRCFRPFFSLSIAGFGVLVMSFCSVLTKKYSGVSIFFILTARFAIMFLISLPIVIFRKQPIFPKGKRLQLLGRSICGTAAITVGNCALRHMPMGDLSMIGSTSTFFVCISAWIFLKEPIDKLNMINIMFVLGGIVMIVQPPFIFNNDYQLYSQDAMALYSAIAQICSAVLLQPNSMVLLRSLKDVPFATVLLTYSVIGFINCLVLLLVFDVYYGSENVLGAIPSTLHEWLIIMVIAFLTYLGPASLTIGAQIEAAGLLSLMRKAFAIIFSYTFQVTLFQETPNSYGIGGASLICFAIIVSAIKKVLDEKLSSTNPIRTKYFKIFFDNSNVIDKHEHKNENIKPSI